MKRRVLVTNDDGVHSPGLLALAAVAEAAGHDVLVAAPSAQSSGASAGLGFDPDADPVITRSQIAGLRNDVLAIAARPGLIALLAMTGQLGPVPDVVLSGVNDASNIGAAVLHSGTAGAALVGAAYGAVGVAVSMHLDDQPDDAPRHWATASMVLTGIIDDLVQSPRGTTFNINIPNVARLDKPLVQADWRPMGCVPTLEPFIARFTAAAGIEMVTPQMERRPGTDIDLVEAGYATISMLRFAGDGPISWAAPRPALRQVRTPLEMKE